MTPHIVTRIAAQGDLLLRRIDSVPSGAVTVPPEAWKHVVAHSETGHHHTVGAFNVLHFRAPDNELLSFLRIDSEYADVVHERPFDTHATLRIGGGCWELRRQREYVPDGWRRVED
jgi:hypothetical protein